MGSSSGSSVFKARDRWDNFNTVAIKKIPLVALTDSFSLTKDYEVPQEEIDYFVSWIVDHYGDHNESLVIPVSEESALNDNDNDNSDNSSGANHGPIELPRVQQRRPPVNKENTRGLEQMVKSLGCFRNDTELWVSNVSLVPRLAHIFHSRLHPTTASVGIGTLFCHITAFSEQGGFFPLSLINSLL
jgi:hypothetical protein